MTGGRRIHACFDLESANDLDAKLYLQRAGDHVSVRAALKAMNMARQG